MIKIEKKYEYNCNYLELDFPGAKAYSNNWIARGVLYQDGIKVTEIEQPIPDSILNVWGTDDSVVVNWFCEVNNINLIQ